jgi:hypothetical protein
MAGKAAERGEAAEQRRRVARVVFIGSVRLGPGEGTGDEGSLAWEFVAGKLFVVCCLRLVGEEVEGMEE